LRCYLYGTKTLVNAIFASYYQATINKADKFKTNLVDKLTKK